MTEVGLSLPGAPALRDDVAISKAPKVVERIYPRRVEHLMLLRVDLYANLWQHVTPCTSIR